MLGDQCCIGETVTAAALDSREAKDKSLSFKEPHSRLHKPDRSGYTEISPGSEVQGKISSYKAMQQIVSNERSGKEKIYLQAFELCTVPLEEMPNSHMQGPRCMNS